MLQFPKRQNLLFFITTIFPIFISEIFPKYFRDFASPEILELYVYLINKEIFYSIHFHL